jgi:hypothetical protein
MRFQPNNKARGVRVLIKLTKRGQRHAFIRNNLGIDIGSPHDIEKISIKKPKK